MWNPPTPRINLQVAKLLKLKLFSIISVIILHIV